MALQAYPPAQLTVAENEEGRFSRGVCLPLAAHRMIAAESTFIAARSASQLGLE